MQNAWIGEGLCTPQLLRSAGAVLLQREVPEEVNARAAGIARAAGVPVVLDCGGVEGPISQELLGSISILSPNETELARLTGAAGQPCCGTPCKRTDAEEATWRLEHINDTAERRIRTFCSSCN